MNATQSKLDKLKSELGIGVTSENALGISIPPEFQWKYRKRG